ncbi:MAG TPA: hypothetical protein VF666_17185 [Pyrinomonadaceae bacterium]|jgi:hypothetical protein
MKTKAFGSAFRVGEFTVESRGGEKREWRAASSGRIFRAVNLMDDVRNWLERLGERIPGYRGYAQREQRRDMDKIHREHLADRLRAVKTPLSNVIRDLSSTGRLMEVTPLDRVLKKLDRIENRVRFASYGYAGFFDATQIREAELDAIYQFDLALVEKTETLETRARQLQSGAGAAELKASVAEVEQAVDDLDSAFDKRYEAINNFKHGGASGDNDAPGKPMFGS